MTVLGVDLGDKRIGIAVSDQDHILAVPLTILDRAADDAQTIQAIQKIINERGVDHIIVGLPYSLSGALGAQALSVLDFVNKLSTAVDIPVETRDERLSTVAVQRMMRETGKKRGKVKQRLDAAAAAFILQGYLDSLEKDWQ